MYTDGSCKGNPGRGGWGVYIINDDGTEVMMTGGKATTTNNEMELTAVVEALKTLKKGEAAIIHSDSKYVIDGITKWMKNWKKNGFKTSTKAPVKNEGLWKEIDALTQNVQVTWQWVRSHIGIRGNEIADALANEGIRIQ